MLGLLQHKGIKDERIIWTELVIIGSSGIDSLAQAQDAYSNQGTFGPPQNTDQQAEQVIQNILGNVGNRSNVRGSTNYNPIFAQAFKYESWSSARKSCSWRLLWCR